MWQCARRGPRTNPMRLINEGQSSSDKRMHSLASGRLRECPLCGGILVGVERKCRNCGSIVEATEPEPKVTQNAAEAAKDATKDPYGLVLLGIPVAGAALLWGWVMWLSILQTPIPKLLGVYLVTTIATGIVVVIDALRLGFGSRPNLDGPAAMRPPVWGAFAAVVWPVAFPLYFMTRRKMGTNDQVAVAVVVTGIFVATALTVGWRTMRAEWAAEANAVRMRQEMPSNLMVSPADDPGTSVKGTPLPAAQVRRPSSTGRPQPKIGVTGAPTAGGRTPAPSQQQRSIPTIGK